MQGQVLKAADLKPLDDDRLLLLAARVGWRVAPWCPPGAEAACDETLTRLVAAARGEPLDPRAAARLRRALSDHGARGAQGTDVRGRARNQAASALAAGLDAATCATRAERWKRVVQAGKHAASIQALLAHDGLQPLEDALTLPWAAMRADVATLAAVDLPRSSEALRDLAPLWPGREPAGARPAP